MLNRAFKLCFIFLVVAVSVSPITADCLENNFDGLEIFVSNWLYDNCLTPDWCSGADTDQSHDVDFIDFAYLFRSKPLVLVDNGTCRVSIHNVVSGSPTTVEQFAATQLQTAFAAATGCTPPINPTTPNAIKINIGVASRFSSGVGNSSSQAYTIRRTINDNIELVGNSTAAVLWAVDEFCKQVLHVTWPAADNVIALRAPLSSSVTVDNLCYTDSPDFPIRGWIIGDNTDGLFYNGAIANWMARNKQNAKTTPMSMLPSTRDRLLERGIKPDGGTVHSFHELIPASTYYATHPEYFPWLLKEGVWQRVKPTGSTSTYVQLCLSNPNVVNIVAQKAYQAFLTYSELDDFGVVQNDGTGGWCQCANCIAMDGSQAGTGNYSNRLCTFLNQVAGMIASYCPNKYIGTLAYQETKEPPTVNVANNVFVYYVCNRNLMKKLTDASDSTNAACMDDINGWMAKAGNVGLYEYYYYSGWAYCPAFYARTLCNEYSELLSIGLKGVFPETTSVMWPHMRIVSYAYAKGTWDSSMTFDQIISGYCVERYGPAAAAMENYHRLYESTIYNNLSSMTSCRGPATQLIPPLFTTIILNTLDGYLFTAKTIAANSGTTGQINAINEDCNQFDMFCRLQQDPATIPGIGSNLILNPGAESNSTNWGFDIRNGSYTGTISTSVFHSGIKSFKITCTGNAGWSRWYQGSIAVTSGKKYVARIWVKAAEGAAGTILIAGNSTLVNFNYVSTNNEWVSLIIPEFIADSNSLTIYMQHQGTGTVYFDDIFLAQLP